MEQEFLRALQAFYYEGKSVMSNEEFHNLKEELMLEGSSVIMLSADEQLLIVHFSVSGPYCTFEKI